MKRAQRTLIVAALAACAPTIGSDPAATSPAVDDDATDADDDDDDDDDADPPSSPTGPPTSAGEETGSATGAETSAGSAETGDDSDSDSDTAGTWVGPCPPYSGLADVGSSWDQSTTAASEEATGYAYDIHREVTDVELGATTRVTMVTTTETTGMDYAATSVTTTIYACDDEGAWLQEYDSQTVGTTAGTPFDVSSVTTYEPAWLAMPWDVSVGSEWTAASTVTTVTEQGPTQTAVSQSYTVTGTDTVEVPAGTFDVLVIGYTGSGSSGTFYTNDEAGGISVAGDGYDLLAVHIVPWSSKRISIIGVG